MIVEFLAAYVFKRKWDALNSKIHELEASLKSCSHKCASERQGRIRAQQVVLVFFPPLSYLCYISHFNVIPFFCLLYFNHDLKCLQALRKELTQPESENLKLTYYPMTPIGVIHSCFSTRLNAYSFIIPFKFYN